MINSKLEYTALSENQNYQTFKQNLNMADCISELIEEILDLTSLQRQRDLTSGVKIFESKKTPKISIKQYIARFQKYTLFSEEVFVCALIYIDRVMFAFPNMSLSQANVHRLLLSTIIIAAKQFQDQLESQDHLARVAGISPQQLMKLELSLIEMLEWRTHIDQKQFLVYIEKLHEKNQAKLSPITSQTLQGLEKKQNASKIKMSDVSTLETSSEHSDTQETPKARSLSMPQTQQDTDEMNALINQVSMVFFS